MTSDSPTPAAPRWLDASPETLNLESTVSHLKLCQFQVQAHLTGTAIVPWLERDPALPGVVLIESAQMPPSSAAAPVPTATGKGQYRGVLSRRQILELLLRAEDRQWFLTQPLYTLNRYGRSPILKLSGDIPIVKAAQRSLRRSPEYQGEPLVVIDPNHGHLLLDSHELNIAYWQIRGLETQVRYERIQVQMVQNDKMASLGRLVDGVAHEILDPVGFIWGNLTHISTYSEQLLELLAAYEFTYPDATEDIKALKAEVELDYLQKDIPRVIQSIRGGADRIRKLASSLQTFCHIDDVYPKPADIHDCLDSIITLLKERLTGDIHIIRTYGTLPPVPCFIGQLSQVFMTLLVNAVDVLLHQSISQSIQIELATTEHQDITADLPPQPQIQIITEVKSNHATTGMMAACWASIRIIDNGPGLSPDRQKYLQDGFTMEKRSARETSLGLSYHIITSKHGGQLKVKSPLLNESGEVQTGTEFEILLPIS